MPNIKAMTRPKLLTSANTAIVLPLALGKKKQCSGAMLKKYIDGNTDGTLAPTGNALRAK